MIRSRTTAKMLATIGGYFWMPCPVCDHPFAGFESGEEALMVDPSSGWAVCDKPPCQQEAKRRSDAMYAARGIQIVRVPRS